VPRKPCTSDGQCADRFICDTAKGAGYCRRTCAGTSDNCQEGSFCEKAGAKVGTCTLATACAPKKGDDDCYGFVCDASTSLCVAPRRCKATPECGGTYACVGGKCKAGCVRDTDCAAGKTCDLAAFVCR
jgi:hypothetical protein